MNKFRLVVKWDDGTHEGFLGHGDTDHIARHNAISKAINTSSSLGQNFYILTLSEYLELPDNTQELINADWSEDFIIP